MYTYRIGYISLFAISGSLGMFLGPSPSPKTAALSHLLGAVLSDRSHFCMLQGPTVQRTRTPGVLPCAWHRGRRRMLCGWRVGWGEAAEVDRSSSLLALLDPHWSEQPCVKLAFAPSLPGLSHGLLLIPAPPGGPAGHLSLGWPPCPVRRPILLSIGLPPWWG